MSEPKPPDRGDGTEVLDVDDLVEIDKSAARPARPKLDPEEAWFVDEEPKQPARRADTLDSFLLELEAPKPPPPRPMPPKSPTPRIPPKPRPETAKPAKPEAVKPEAVKPVKPVARDPLELFRPVAVTPAAAPVAPPVVTSDDDRWHREVEALAPSLPTRAALLQTFRACVSLQLRGDAATAARLCARAAELAPDARVVAMTTRRIAAARNDARATIAAARAEIPLAGDPSERLALLWQIAALEPVASAEATLRQILELDPQDLAAWLALAASATQRKSWSVAVEAWEAIAGRSEDGVARAAFLASAAKLRDAFLSDLDGARLGFERAVEADPTSAPAHAGLQSVHLRKRSVIELARVVGLEAQCSGDHDPALGYHEHAGDLAWECVHDASAAVRCYEHAATLAHADVVQLGKLASLYEQEGRAPQLAAVYERLLERLQDPQRRGAVLYRLAALYESRLDKPDDAIRCYRAALDAVPTLAPAAQALAQIYQAKGRWQDAAAVLLLEVDRLADSAVRAARYVAIADLLEAHVGASPQVVTLLERALALDPSQTAALDALDRLYRAGERWDNIIALHETQLAQTSHPLRARALRLSLATLYLDRAKAPDKAAEQLRAAMTGPPDRFFMLVGLARALAEAGKWTEHVAVLEDQAKLVGDGVELVATLYRIATVVETRLGDPARALAGYLRVLDNQPRHELALHSVLRLHRAQSRWEQVIASERRLLELIERPEEAAVILHRIAQVAEDHLSRHDDAIEAYEEALRHLPSYRPARVALERLLRAAGRFDRLAGLLEDQAAGVTKIDRARLLCQAALVRELHCTDQVAAATKLYEQALAVEAAMPTALWGLHRIRVAAADWRGAAASLGLLVRQARHDTTRARLLVQLAGVHERIGDNGRALELLGAALSAHTTPASTYERLRLALSLASTGERTSAPDAPRWLDEAADVTSDPGLASGLLRLRASMLEQSRSNTAQSDAADAYTKALSVTTTAAALEGLARNARGPQLAETLAQRASLLKDPPARALLYAMAGALHERSDAADAAYREALAAQSDFLPALAGRLALAAAAGDWRAAATLCAEQAALATDRRNVVELYEQAAAMFVERLGDDASAIACYREALTVEPGRRVALDRALDLLETAGDWGQAATLIAEQIGSVADEAARADLLSRRARVLAERLGDADGAIADIDRALVLRPGNPELLTLLASLHEAVAHWADAARVYEQLAQSSDASYRRPALVAQARIWTTEVPDYARAQRLLEAAHALDPSDRNTLVDLSQIASKAGDTKRASELLEDLGRIGTARERVAALIASVDLRRSLGTASADDSVAGGIALALEDPAVIPMLESYYRSHDKLDGYVAAAEAAIGRALTGSPGAPALRVSLGRIYAREVAASERAIPFLRAAVTDAPDDPQLRIALAGTLATYDDRAALAELRHAIELDPVAPIAYQRLAALYARVNLDIAASLASSAAALLGDDDGLARMHIALLAIDNPLPGSLPPDDAFSIVVGGTRVPDLRRVVAILDPHVNAIFPDRQRLLAGSAPAPDRGPAGAIRAIAAALGIATVTVHLRDRAEAALVGGVFVVAPGDDSRSRFEAGAVLSRFAGGSILGLAAPAAEVRALLEAIDNPDAPDDHDFRKRVSQALPRRARKDLERLVADTVAIDAKAITTWQSEEQARATRIGLIACGDLRAVARAICPEALAAKSADERRARLRQSPKMIDALHFSTTEACLSACRRMYGRG